MAFDLHKHIKEHGANTERIASAHKRLDEQRASLSIVAADVTSLKESRAYIRGGWATILTVATVAGSVGAVLARAFWH